MASPIRRGWATRWLRISWPGNRPALRPAITASARPLTALFCQALLVAACGGSASPAPSPAPSPTPTPTPNPHLTEPASVDAVFTYLTGIGGLRIVANTASVGVNGVPSKVIDATYAGWPLTLSQFASHAQLVAATKFNPKDRTQVGDAPYSIVGLNILVEYGPRSGRTGVTPPDHGYVNSAIALATVLDQLLGPLAQRSVQPIALPTKPPAPAASPAAPSGSAKPSPKASPSP